jgi:hypothetical protein
MLKGSALYLVIVIALVMAVICSSLIAAAYFYKLQYQYSARYGALQQNLGSAVNILLAGATPGEGEKRVSLYRSENDTVLIAAHPWGIYEFGTARAVIQEDTLARAFTLARTIDSASWSALYLVDEDRPLSVSGRTMIKGTAFLPKAGLKEAYVSGQAYQGDKRLVIGSKKVSSKTLPALGNAALQQLEKSFNTVAGKDSVLLRAGSVSNSFMRPTLSCSIDKKVYTLTNALSGNIVLHSDTTVVIAGSARLQNVLVFARVIVVEEGFRGSCQLFASDSISVGKNCHLDFPSAIGVLNFAEKALPGTQQKLSIGENTSVSGSIFTYEKSKNELRPLIELEKNVRVSGQLYAPGLLNFKDGVQIRGSVMAARFIYQTAYTRYENYLINLKIDGPALSPYYLTSALLPSAASAKKILQWLP